MRDEYRDGYIKTDEEVSDTDKIKRKAKIICSRLGLSFAAFLGVTFLIQVVIAVLYRWGVFPFPIINPEISVILSMVSMYAFGFPACYLICGGIETSAITKTKWGAGRLAVSFIICMGTLYVGNIAGQVLMYLAGIITGRPMVNNVEDLLLNVNPLIVFLMTVVVAPITEELIFRKMLISRTIRYGQGISMVLSGVMFGLAHGNFYQFFYAFGLGMIFAYIYMNTGSIRYTIVFHMIINFLGSMLPLSLLKLMGINAIAGSVMTFTYGMLIIGCVITGIVLLIVYRRRITLKPGLQQIPRGSRFKTVFLNVGMAVYLVVCVVTFVIG